MRAAGRLPWLATLRARFLLALLAVSVLPLGLVGLVVVRWHRLALADQSAQELVGLARGLAGQVDSYVESLLNATMVIAGLPEVTGRDPARQTALLHELYLQYPGFARISVFDPAGRRLASSHPGGAPSIWERASFQAASVRGQQAWEVAAALSTGRPSLLIHTPIRDDTRAVVGVLGVVVDLETLSRVVARVPVGGGGRAFILDADGHVLLHPESEAVQGRRDYSGLGLTGQGRLAGPGVARYDREDGTYTAGYAPALNTGWIVVVERPDAVVLAPAEAAWRLELAGLGATVLFATGVALWLAGTLTAPIQALARAARALEAGDETAPLPTAAAGSSELAALVGAFAAMRRAIVVREKENARLVAQLETQYQYLPLPTYTWQQHEQGLLLLDYNRAAAHHLPPQAALVRGSAAETLLADTPALLEALHRCVAARSTVQSEARLEVPPLGLSGYFVVTAVFVPPDLAMLHLEDITARKQAEQQQAALARSEKLCALGQLAGGVAHDLNQNLALIAGHSDLALRTLATDGRSRDRLTASLRLINQAALDGAETVKRLLRFARSGPEGPALPVDLRALLRDTAELTAPRWRDAAQAEGRPIHLAVEAPEAAVVHGSPERLREALTNLVFNAIDALPHGGAIRLAAHRTDRHVTVTVADTGVGMTPEVQAHIFEPFFSTKGEHGTGLGLAMVYAVVEQHGGEITVDSAPGRGTTIRLVFPAAMADAAAPAPTAPEASLAPLRVLVVDDEPALRALTAAMLTPLGHHVTEAASAEEALVHLQRERFDVVLADVGMGAGMNGWELTARIHHDFPGVPVILATGWGAAIDPEAARAQGVAAVLPKPYRLTDLMQALAVARPSRSAPAPGAPCSPSRPSRPSAAPGEVAR